MFGMLSSGEDTGVFFPEGCLIFSPGAAFFILGFFYLFVSMSPSCFSSVIRKLWKISYVPENLKVCTRVSGDSYMMLMTITIAIVSEMLFQNFVFF